MGNRIDTNPGPAHAQRIAEDVSTHLSGSVRRLSTGLRITTAAEDAASVQVSERLRAQIRAEDQAKRNTNDGISLLQTIEASLTEVSTLLVHLRDLAVQAAKDTTSGSNKDTLQQEFDSLRSEIDRTAHSTAFASINPLDGSSSVVSFQAAVAGASDLTQISVSLDPVLSTSLVLSTLDIGSGSNPVLAIRQVDAAIDTITSLRGRLGTVQDRLSAIARQLSGPGETAATANSRIHELGLALETATQTRHSIMEEASLAILGQANAQAEAALLLLGAPPPRRIIHRMRGRPPTS